MKNAEQSGRKNSRLAAQNYFDDAASKNAKKAPTVHQLSQCVLLSTEASMEEMEVFTCDIKWAYVQSVMEFNFSDVGTISNAVRVSFCLYIQAVNELFFTRTRREIGKIEELCAVHANPGFGFSQQMSANVRTQPSGSTWSFWYCIRCLSIPKSLS